MTQATRRGVVMGEKLNRANGISGPYWLYHAANEIQVQGRHGAIVRRYPATKIGEACANEDVRLLQKGYGKQQKAIREAAFDLLAALKALHLQALQSDLNNPANEYGYEAIQNATALINSLEAHNG